MQTNYISIKHVKNNKYKYHKWDDFEQFLLVFATILKMEGKWGDKKYLKIAYQRSWAILPNAVFSETVSEMLYCLAEIKVPFKVTLRFEVTLNGSFNLTFKDNFLMVIDRE